MSGEHEMIRRLRELAEAMPSREEENARITLQMQRWFGVTPRIDEHGHMWLTREQWDECARVAKPTVPSPGGSNAALGIPVHIIEEDEQ